MSCKIFNNLARGAGIASVLAMSPLAANAANINLSVASNFYISGTPGVGTSPIADLIAAYVAIHTSDTITVVENGSTGTLEGSITGGNPNDVDLFLAADTDHPQDLYNNHSSWAAGSPFIYAIGTSVLWSNTTGVNISAGLPNPPADNFVIARPDTAPYGYAAIQVINGVLGTSLTKGTTYPYTINANSTLDTKTNIDVTWTNVDNQTYKYGFVAKSQVCHLVSGVETFTGTSHHVYTSNGSPGYMPIEQAAMKINRSSGARTTLEENLLTSFVAYLQDHTTSPSNSQMVTTLLDYCYQVPSP
jgi:molybdate transport system substrate-binding protein